MISSSIMPGSKAVPYRSENSIEWDDISGDETIDLESHDLSTLDIGALTLNGTRVTRRNVTELNLNYNSLSSLPCDLADTLPKLQILSLCGNDLKDLPPCVGCLQDLRTLSVNENELSVLPATLFHLSNLAELHLLGNKLTHLNADICRLKSLRSLTLEDNQLAELPSDFGSLENLSTLEASENNLEHLPRNFGCLTNLSILNLSRNKLLELPASFGNLPSLQYLDISNNFLSELSPTLKSASTCLLKFSAMDNLLKSFPPWIGELTHIQEVYIGNNYIDDKLPEDFGSVSGHTLRHMDLGANHLECLPSSIGLLANVETLHFGSHILEIERRAFQNGNRITHLPESFGQMRNLRHLRLDENQLYSLPDSIGGLQSLEYFDLGQNVLRGLPASFSQLTSLKTCLLSKNHIEKLPHDFGNLRALERLRLNTNQLRDLPPSFCQLVNLRAVDLNENLLSDFPACLNHLPNLVHVGVDENNFELDDLDIVEMSKLDSLAIYPEDGIHKFVRTTESHTENKQVKMTGTLAMAVKKGDSVWKSHVTPSPNHDDGMSATNLRDEESHKTNENDLDEILSNHSDHVHGSDFGAHHHTEPENWDMEVDDGNPYSCDFTPVYQHASFRRSPVGKDILNFQFVPSDEHPPALPVPDTEFDFEDGQFDDAD